MKAPVLTVTIAIGLISLYIVLGAMPDTLMFQSTAPQWWQWVSAHYVHISTEHLFWNLLAFVALGSLIEQRSRCHLLLCLFVGTVFVDSYLLSLFSMSHYAGMSGILHTLLVVALYHLFQKSGYRLAAILSFIASTAKLLFEWHFNTSLITSLAWPSVPQAHFFGLVGGLLIVIVSAFATKHSTLRIQFRPSQVLRQHAPNR